MGKKIALQLYSFRDVPFDYETKVRQIAEMGYAGVETAGFPGSTPEKAARLFKELGLAVVAAHVGLPLGEKKNEILDTLEALGKPRMVCTQIRPQDMESMDAVRHVCARLNEGYAIAKGAGITFGIHNHWWEFGYVNGRLAHDVMVELLDPQIFFEIDTYWVKVGGSDPAAVVKALGPRVPLLHIKDGPGNREAAMTAVGDGVMDIPGVLAAALPDAWQIVELDRCDTDVMAAIKKSCDYLSAL